MKKLYAFLASSTMLIMLVALGILGSEVANAQTYTSTSYVFHQVNTPDAQGLGSGPNWNPQSLTVDNSGELQYYAPYYFDELCGASHLLPFNFTLGAAQLVGGTNSFTITCSGNVVLSPTWPSPDEDYELPYGDYNFTEWEPYGVNESYYNYCEDLTMEESEYDDAPYLGEFANYILMPFSTGGEDYCYLPELSSNPTKFSYGVLGSAPNRELVIEVDYMHCGYDGIEGSFNTWTSFQTVIYEGGLSKFQFNYGPTVGTNPFGFDKEENWAPLSVNGVNWPGSWDYAYAYNEGSYLLIEDYGSYVGFKLTPNNFAMVDFGGNGWNANNKMYVAYNTPYGSSGEPLFPDTTSQLPQSSILFAVAYPYDLTAGAITLPKSEEPYPLNTPFTPTATMTNSGSSVPTSCSVLLTISEVGVGQVYNEVLSMKNTAQAASGIFPAIPAIPASFGQTTIQFPSYTPGVSSLLPAGNGNGGYGIYEDTMIIYNLAPTADQNPSDNEVTNEWICSPPNDIKAVQVINPPNGTATQIDVATPISIRFRNLGTNNQTNVPVSAVVRNASGTVVFRDTLIIPNWPAGPTGGNSTGTQDYSTSGQGPGIGAYYDTAFPATPSWTPSTLGTDTVFGIALMYPQDGANTTDALSLDDTTKSATPILPEYDAAAIRVINPPPGGQEAYATSWPPEGVFQDVGVVDLFQVLVVVQIHRCSDGQVVFQSDTTETALNVDDGQVGFYFPTKSGPYNIATIPPGCYNECVIADYDGDINYVNDTACAQFSILNRLIGNYYVGVGKQFQSIHQAVDTMRFRGIGGNVRLILTDTSYTENGTYDVSTPQGAVDMRNISGLSDTSTVTWIPYPGVHPTIHFTGKQPFCFYMGDGFPGFMSWEGYNPSTVPTPDLVVPEPAKRGMTITSAETNNGAVFGIEEGACNITLKDLIIHGNGSLSQTVGFASDSCMGIRIFNGHSQFVFASGVHDTVAMHEDNINNCEIGNAKYGIYDHGFHDAFDPQQGVYRSWKNYDNTFTRNTIGTTANPISYAGIQFNGENGLVISHNVITNINASVIPKSGGLTQSVYGILSPNMNTYIGPSSPGGNPVWPGDTGNITQTIVNGNLIQDLTSLSGNSYGISLTEGTWVYKTTGLTTVTSVLPFVTQNRIVNNMILDLWSGGGAYPITMNTSSSTYSTDLDSVFNNSISTTNAKQNITIQYAKHVFLWDNIIQNTGSGPYTNYWLEVPRPYASAISSDYNLFDLHGNNVFDSVIEYDVRYGTVFQRQFFLQLQDWRSYIGQDMHSLTGNPLFATPAMGTDSLHMPPALTYIESPAANTGEWLGTATQATDFDGTARLAQNGSVDIGAQEWDAFQYTNDLAVEEIVQPAGFSQTSDTVVVTTASPLWINAVVRNLSSVGVYNVPVTATVQRSIRGSWTTVGTYVSEPMTWAVNQSLNVVFQGPALTPANDTGVFQVIVSVPNDQNNANNSQATPFRILLKQNAVIVSYNGANSQGIQNLDSVMLALNRLGVPFDTIDRNSPKGLPNSTIIDYTPWWTLVWAMGDPDVAPVPGQPTGQGGLSLQETDEVTRYLNAGLSYAKKSMVIAGQDIAWYNGFLMSNNPVTDTQWMQSTMHTKYYARTPVSGAYNGSIVGQQPAYWTYADYIREPQGNETDLSSNLTPNVLLPATTTAAVGPIVNGYAYTYGTHPLTPNDSGAGITYYNTLINTVFYGFDWANPYQVGPQDTLENNLTSGTTRTLAAAFAFFRGHQGTVLPVDFVDATASYIPGSTNALIKWDVATQKDVAMYNVEQQNQDNWSVIGHVNPSDNETAYSFTQVGNDPTQSYTYRISAVDESGSETYSNTVELGPDPSEMGFTLGQSYPNPTPGVTEISFTLPEASQVSIRIIDVTGKVVNTDVTNVPFAAGSQTVKLDLSALPSGNYLYQMVATGADGQSATLSNKLSVEKQ